MNRGEWGNNHKKDEYSLKQNLITAMEVKARRLRQEARCFNRTRDYDRTHR